MGTVILIGTAAIVVAVVGCFFIWRIDASRADEVEHVTPAPQPAPPPGLQSGLQPGLQTGLQAGAADSDPAPPRPLGS